MREDVPLPGQAIHVLGRQDLSRPVRRRQTLIDYLRRHGRAFEGTARAAGQLRADMADDQSSPECRRTGRRGSLRGRGGAQLGAGYYRTALRDRDGGRRALLELPIPLHGANTFLAGMHELPPWYSKFLSAPYLVHFYTLINNPRITRDLLGFFNSLLGPSYCMR